MDSFTVKVEEMIARELRAARGWLIAVALLAFVQDILFAYNLPPKIQSKHQLFVIIACVQFAVFFGAWLLSHWKPKFSLILALIEFWIIQGFVIVMSPLESGFSLPSIVFRLAFTLALIGGISAADRAEEMERNRQTSDTPAAPDEDASGVEEMIARELRAARGWLIAVTLLAFVLQILFAYKLPPKIQSKHQLFVIIACVQFAVFFGAWLLFHWKPKFSLILALIDFWIIQVFVIVMSPLESGFSPYLIVFRLAFTLALIRGISAADRAEEMERNRQTSDTPAAPDEDASGVVASASTETPTSARHSPPALRPEVIVSAQSHSEADALVKRAQDHHFAKRFSEAIELYEEVVTRFPESKQAARARAQIKNLR